MAPVSDPPRSTYRFAGIGFDARITQCVALSTTLLLLDYFHRLPPIQSEGYERFVFCFLAPGLLIVLGWRENLRDYGLRLGDWRLGVPLSLATMLVIGAVIFWLGRLPDFRAYYQTQAAGRAPWLIVLDAGVELFAWEFFFRGWLLFAFARKYGTDAIWLQAVPFAFMHLPLKPELETLSTIFGGALFGMLAWKTRSALYGWVIHWFQAALMLVVAGGHIG